MSCLDANPDVFLCRYGDFTTKPNETMRAIYRFIGIDFPRNNIVRGVDSRSLGLGREIRLREEIEELCNDLWERLNACYELSRQMNSSATSRT